MALASAGAAAAQEAPPVEQTTPAAADDIDGSGEIVVVATRIPGQVQTDSPPVLELNEEEVAAYGATSIADLVNQLAPQTGSGRGRGGRPVFLVNGQRVSGFREFSRFPPEAIRKVEVLPEEVALQFGYPPDARVINFILKDNFASREIEAEYGMPTAGGTGTGQLEASLLTIDGARRVNVGVDYQRTSLLTEAERDVVQTTTVPSEVIAAGLDPADYRALVARRESVTGNATVTQGLGELGSGGQLTLSGEVGRSVTRSLSGIDTVDLAPIERRSETDTYSLGSAFNRALGAWRLSATLDATRTDSDSRRDISNGVGADRALSRVWSATQKNTLSGSPFRLPGGEANLTFDAGYDWTRIESSDTRTIERTQLTRGNVNGGASLSLPITSTREGFLDAIGDVSVNLGGGVDHLSDFGTLTDWNAGLNWRPTERLALQGSYVVREAAPGLSQLGSPQIVDVNVPVYDFATGQTALATVTTGGNPDLLAETQRDLKLSASYDLDLFDRANILVEYFRNNSNDTTESFPLLTPAVEQAFPERVTRGADGTLLAVDRRPVTFAERSSSRIRYGFNVFGRVGKPAPEGRGGGGRGFRGFMAAAQPAPADAPSGPGTNSGDAQGTRGGGQFDAGQFDQMRVKFCATPAGENPDLIGMPERMLERLKGEDGQLDPAKIAALRKRFCNADGTPNLNSGPRRFDPAQFGALRAALACGVEGKEPDLAALPPEAAARLKGPDGTIDPARLSELRTRICAIPAGDIQGQRGPSGGEGRRRGGQGAAVGGSGTGGPGGGGGSRGGMRGMMGGGGDGQGRWNLSLYHSIELSNQAQIAPGNPPLDLLEGEALGESGVSRHTIQLEGGVFYRGIGTRVSGNYRSGSTVRGSDLPGASDLRFGDLVTFDLRSFVNLEQQKWLTGNGDPGFWKGTRFGVSVRNLLDTRQRVTDESGSVPLRYQPGLIDPVGRFVEIEFRKMF
ncbi:TonB-dependent receptor plug domain-containing protein [Tsuneonella sp. HG249]